MDTQQAKSIARMGNFDQLNKDGRKSYHMTVPLRPNAKLSRWGRGPRLSPVFLKRQAAEINRMSAQ